MHQSFAKLSETERTAERIAGLRRHLAETGLTGFLVPRSDEYQNEYVPAASERLRWLTGFSGSAGLAVVLSDRAAVFIDGRYVLQVHDEVDLSLVEPQQVPQHDPAEWLAGASPAGGRVGFDARLHSAKSIEQWRKTLTDKKVDVELVPVTANPIDAIWNDRPAPPLTTVEVHPLKLAGCKAADKITQMQTELKEKGVAGFLLTAPASIDWLLNIRATDVPHTPLALCRAIVPAEGPVELFIEPERLPATVHRHFNQENINVLPPGELEPALARLARLGRIAFDPDNASYHFHQLFERLSASTLALKDPSVLPRAIKNTAEISGMRQAHIRDGVAVSRFLHWLSKNGTRGIDEIAAAQRLEAFRAESEELRDLSFETISGSGPNGAIVHYRVNETSNRKLGMGELFLVDSGGQYRDGTTDITRTIAIGTPGNELMEAYTLVLKGHIAIASARFPKGTRGVDIDALARINLWKAGFDYDHGTGHGVGAYLGVHEGPQNISKRGMAELVPGMIVSNEPGYYRTGRFGIRIENLVLVTRASLPDGGEREMLGFETLTLAPLDLNLIDPAMLERYEIEWLNDYHRQVYQTLAPLLADEDERNWLRTATERIGGPAPTT